METKLQSEMSLAEMLLASGKEFRKNKEQTKIQRLNWNLNQEYLQLEQVKFGPQCSHQADGFESIKIMITIIMTII